MEFEDNFIYNFKRLYSEKVQLSQYQVQVIAGAIMTRAPDCRMLVFGLGFDSLLWSAINKTGYTHFVESSDDWINEFTKKYKHLQISRYFPKGISVSSSLRLSDAYLEKYSPPSELQTHWDVILIDGPPGNQPHHPGRAIAISWAARLAHSSTHIFVDDYDRDLERKFSDRLLRRRTASYVLPASDHASHRQLFWSVGSATPPSKAAKATVLTVSTPNYSKEWRFCIDSQIKYSRRYNFFSKVVDPIGIEGHAKWAKLILALEILKDGHDVLLIDADAEISHTCPSFIEILNEHINYDIFIANGISGRPNSGVMILRGGTNSCAIKFLEQILKARNTAVPKEDFVTGEGENGHVIHFLKQEPYKSKYYELSQQWNCSLVSKARNAFIRHYTNDLRRHLKSLMVQRS